MGDIKEKFKQDFEKANNVDLSFDVEKLEPNTKKSRHKIRPYKKVLIFGAVAMASVVVIVSIPAGMLLIRTKESVRTYRRFYSMNETSLAEANTVRKLNLVGYPNQERPTKSILDENEKNAYGNFSNATYHGLVDSSKKDNMSYAVVGLYSMLNELEEATSNDDLNARLNELLGQDKEGRKTLYRKIMRANSFSKDTSSIQLKNAAFFHNEYRYSQAYVDTLSNMYCEAYQLDFAKDAGKIVEWVNKAVDSQGFIDENYLNIDSESQLYLLSTLFFKNAWMSKYLSENNIVDDFFLENGSAVKTTYMSHTYYDSRYYDYGSYISFRDYYQNGNASVTYIVPKDAKDNIYDLTKNENIFIDKEENKIEAEEYSRFKINLKTPKFAFKTDIDFENALKHLGFADIFNKTVNSFGNAFDDENLAKDNLNIYLQQMKQRNEVEFNEDGSIVKSLSLSGLGAGSAAPMKNNTLDVELNQPFIYIIRDINDTPIFVGHVDNPII